MENTQPAHPPPRLALSEAEMALLVERVVVAVAPKLVETMVPLIEARMEERLMARIGRTFVGRFSIALALLGTCILSYAAARGWITVNIDR